MDENLNLLKLPQKHLVPIQQVESKRMNNTPTAFFSGLNEDQLTAIFGEGLRCQFSNFYLIYNHIFRDLKLFGTLQVALDSSPDPLLQQNAFVDVFNREFDNPIRINSMGFGELPHLSCTSFPVSSTSVLQIAAKLYVTTDKLDDAETYIVDYSRKPTEREAIQKSKLLIEDLHIVDENEAGPMSQVCRRRYDESFHNEAFHVCDDHTFINISSMPYGYAGEVTFVGKDGSLTLGYFVFKYAVDVDLEVEFSSTKHENVTGELMAVYPAYGEAIKLFEYHSSTSFITPGKMNLIRSELAVPANSYISFEAELYEWANPRVKILSGTYEFRVPCDGRSSIETIQGEGCYLKLKLNWKLPSEEPKIPSSSNPSVSRLTERRKFGAHSTPTMADLDERNRWSVTPSIWV